MAVKLLIVLALCAAAVTAQSRCSETLQQGSRGDCVRYLQRVVGVTADGIFGQNTRQAVINFQQSHGLVADGIVGRNTWAAIYRSAGSSGSGSHSGSDSDSDSSSDSDSGGAGGSSNKCGSSYDYARGTCSGGPTQGARKLAQYLKNRDGGRQEIYNCRRIAGSSTLSLHSEGRAVDHYITGSRGTATFNHLVSIACQNGIQEVIFNRRIWTQGRGVRDYTGVSPHTDHIHVGLNRCGAQNFNL